MNRVIPFFIAGAVGLLATPVLAKVSADKAAALGLTGTALTPVGAERAANKDGSIPEWQPYTPHDKLIQTPVKYNKTNFPYQDEKPLYTITKANLDKYKDQLSEGHKILLQRYPDYKMNVYPSHRPAAFPKAIYEATIKNATTAYLEGGNPDKIRGATLGFPFPIPTHGNEPLWNHRLKWRGNAAKRYNNQAIVRIDGDTQITKTIEEVKFVYANLEKPGSMNGPDDIFLYYLSNTIAPPRSAGQFLLAWEHADYRDAWLYNPALRRIRRAPSVAYDNPYEGTDGQEFYDQVDMYNGKFDRFTWKLVGKKEMIIPYNNSKISAPDVTFKQILTPKHINQDLPRYEQHRVWIVEAENTPDKPKHTFKKRVFYIDEDTWNVVMIDNYDHRDQYYKFQEGFLTYVPTIKASSTIPELIYDLQTGTYFATAMTTEGKPSDFTVRYDDKHFSPRSISRRIKR